ncbi:MAG: hypothetical protein GY943_37810 [Chloroflexi bacterium]|nr:hypothetical protein [Chloroflexota bacterium]
MSRQTREEARRQSWLTEAQAAIGWGIVLVLAALLGTIYLRQASKIAAVGRRVQITQIELDNIKRSNSQIEQQIAEAQSLDRLQEEAIRLGFKPAQPEDIEYIIVPDYPVTSKSPTSTPLQTAPPPIPVETMGEAIWQSVKSRIGSLIQGEAGE